MADIYEDVTRLAYGQPSRENQDLRVMSSTALEQELEALRAERTAAREEAERGRQALSARFEPQIAALRALLPQLEELARVIDLEHFSRGAHEGAGGAGHAERLFRGMDGREGEALRAAKVAINIMERETATPRDPNADWFSKRHAAIQRELQSRKAAKAERLARLREELAELGLDVVAKEEP